MERREFVALVIAAGSVCAGLNVGCSTQDTPPKKTTQDNPSNTNSTGGAEKTESANNTTAAGGSEGETSIANTSTNKPQPTSTPKPKTTPTSKPTPTPKPQPSSESPTGVPDAFSTVCQTTKGRYVECCTFPDGTAGPCIQNSKGKWVKGCEFPNGSFGPCKEEDR